MSMGKPSGGSKMSPPSVELKSGPIDDRVSVVVVYVVGGHTSYYTNPLSMLPISFYAGVREHAKYIVLSDPPSYTWQSINYSLSL
jgi:hypothetical protein